MDAALDFAYRYPFSKEAKEQISGMGLSTLDYNYLVSSKRHIETALDKGLEFTKISIDSVKRDYLITYAYSRMLLSALKNKDMIKRYAAAEAARSGSASLLYQSGDGEFPKISEELGLKASGAAKRGSTGPDDYVTISFADYLNNAPQNARFGLQNQKLKHGMVFLDRIKVVGVVEGLIAKEIEKGLPIPEKELPKQVIDFAKANMKSVVSVKVQLPKKGAEAYMWIEKLLQTPIGDVRHRTVNLILAPYLTNVRGLSAEDAAKIIGEYIERCKQIDPATKVNETYIRYQCNYAKRRGLRPLSFDRAQELLGEIVIK